MNYLLIGSISGLFLGQVHWQGQSVRQGRVDISLDVLFGSGQSESHAITVQLTPYKYFLNGSGQV